MAGQFSVIFRDKQVGRKYKALMDGHARRHKRALISASNDALKEMLDKGRRDIAEAGNFGKRWTDGLKGTVTSSGNDINIEVTHAVSYFMVHQEGATIRGRPLLWIPLSFNSAAQGVMARDYPHPLVRVDRKSGGAPLLLDTVTKEPAYFGKTSVRIPKRFHVIEILREVAKTIPRRFDTAMKGSA